ncbi:MAG TPA: fumarylacetoacetate hydrolase family protein [Candidatus Baltobacteraceae bacterium]|nr:fumarylacetoacetate hydrolase family protein [Candidatus Baltobacteraceae bacterium]
MRPRPVQGPVKLVSYRLPGHDVRAARYGVVREAGVVDASTRLGARYASLRDVLDADALDELRRAVDGASPEHALDDVALLPPIPEPQKIFCIGVNYTDRNAEYRDGSDIPKYPSVFMRAPGSLVGHRAPILRPPESEQLDYEGEIAIVIGKRGRRIPRERARDHVAGLTCMNEGTIRDWLRHGKFNVTQGKNFVASGAIGPWIVTTDELPAFDDIRVTTRVNGEIRQHDTTANLAFPFDMLIAYLSRFAELVPGDVIATGTPTGAGARFDPPRWLVPGDVVDVTVDHVGTLSNLVVDELSPA